MDRAPGGGYGTRPGEARDYRRAGRPAAALPVKAMRRAGAAQAQAGGFPISTAQGAEPITLAALLPSRMRPMPVRP
ncbi:MAG: hypothetical protein OHK0026_02100 [Rhodocyclaceae bacterium]